MFFTKYSVLSLKASNPQGNLFLSEWATSDMVLNSQSDRDPTFYIYDLQHDSGRFEPAYIIGYTITNGRKERVCTSLILIY